MCPFYRHTVTSKTLVCCTSPGPWTPHNVSPSSLRVLPLQSPRVPTTTDQTVVTLYVGGFTVDGEVFLSYLPCPGRRCDFLYTSIVLVHQFLRVGRLFKFYLGVSYNWTVVCGMVGPYTVPPEAGISRVKRSSDLEDSPFRGRSILS